MSLFVDDKNIRDRENGKFGPNRKKETAVKVIHDDTNYNTNALEILFQDVTTVASQVVFPEGTGVQVFHQTEDAVIYYGGESVDSSYPKLVANSTLDINAKNDFTLWVVSDSGTVPLFVMTDIKE